MKKGLIAQLTFGTIITLLFLYMFTNASVLFPLNYESMKWGLLTYMIMFMLPLVVNSASGQKTEATLFRANFLKSAWKFPLFAGISLTILYGIGYLIKGQLPSLNYSVLGATLGVLLFYNFLVAIVEEITFRGWLYDTLKKIKTGKNKAVAKGIANLTQAIIFAVFHYAMAGGEVMLLFVYVVLGVIFAWVKDTYSPQTNMANAGVHFAWNVFVLAFMQ